MIGEKKLQSEKWYDNLPKNINLYNLESWETEEDKQPLPQSTLDELRKFYDELGIDDLESGFDSFNISTGSSIPLRSRGYLDLVETSNPYLKLEKTNRILKYLRTKYTDKIGIPGYLKVLSSISPHVNNQLPNLNICDVAPPGQFKTRSSIEAQSILPKRKWNTLKDDDTMHAIFERYRNGNVANLGRKALFLDDATTLFATKPKRVKDRIISGFTKLLSQGDWSYGERQNPDLILKGNISLIMNLTLESYMKYESKLLGSTFLERFLTIFYNLSEPEIMEYIKEEKERNRIVVTNKLHLKLKPTEIDNLDEYNDRITNFAKEYSRLNFKSITRSQNQIIALLKSHLALNERNVIVDNDLELLELIKPYLVNPLAVNQDKIIGLAKKGLNVRDICKELKRDPEKYNRHVYRVLKKAKERGVLDVYT